MHHGLTREMSTGLPSNKNHHVGSDDPTCRWVTMLVACVAVTVSLFHVAESDLFWHLRTGERILSEGLDRAEVYSYTSQQEIFHNHEWLAEVIAAALYRGGGFDLLVAAKASAAGALMILLAIAAKRRNAAGLAIPLALLYAVALTRFRFYVRPELLTLLLLPTVDILAQQYLQRGSRRILVAIPVIAALWANLHPGVLIGIAVIGAHGVGAAVDRAVRREPPGRRGRPLLLIAAAVTAFPSTFITPYGPAIFTPLVQIYTSEAIANASVREWQPPSGDSFLLFYLLIAAAAALLVLTARRITAGDALLWLGTGFMALTSLRYIGIYAVVSAPIVARHLDWAAIRLGPRARAAVPSFAKALPAPVRATAVSAAALWLGATLLSTHASVFHIDQSRLYRFGTGLDNASAPIETVEVLEARRLTGPLYNSWAFGGYLIWRSWPRLHVFLDGRDFMQVELIEELRRSTPAEILQRYRIRTALVSFDDESFARELLDSAQYRLVAFDDRAMLFADRERIATAPALETLHLLRPDDLSLAWYDRLPQGERTEARRQAVRAVELASDSARPWAILGTMARREGDLEVARDAYRRAVELNRAQSSFRNNLGAIELDAGRAQTAARRFQEAIRRNPDDFAARFNLGLALDRAGDARGARRAFQSTTRRWPEAAEPWYFLGRVTDDPEESRTAFTEYLRRAPDGPYSADALQHLAP
jgi:tetratricopeptide (TPR) repeat protein